MGHGPPSHEKEDHRSVLSNKNNMPSEPQDIKPQSKPQPEPPQPEPGLASSANGHAKLGSPNHNHCNNHAGIAGMSHHHDYNKNKTNKQMTPDGHGPASYDYNKNEKVIMKSLHNVSMKTKKQNTINMTSSKTSSKTYKDALIGK